MRESHSSSSMYGARECATNHKANHWDTIHSSVTRQPWRLRHHPITMIIMLVWFDRNDAREPVILTATMSHKCNSLIAWECANDQHQELSWVWSHESARMIKFICNEDHDEQLLYRDNTLQTSSKGSHVRLQPRLQWTTACLTATKIVTINLKIERDNECDINLTIGESVRPHNFQWKLGPPTLQGIACCKQLQQLIATINLKKGTRTHTHHLAGDCGCTLGSGWWYSHSQPENKTHTEVGFIESKPQQLTRFG